MSHIPHKREHGTTKSYIVGYLLSLVFTIDAYYLVVNKSFTGTRLLATVLVFAVLQMAVQVFFFLHLGRGPKPMYNVVFFVGTASLILVVVIGSIFIMNNLHYNMGGTEVTKKLAQDEAIAQVGGVETGACKVIGTNYRITISKGRVSPAHTEARLCDSLTFINQDSGVRSFEFGPAPEQDNYTGQKVTAYKGYAKIITLNQSGTYTFRDRADPAIAGDFTVKP